MSEIRQFHIVAYEKKDKEMLSKEKFEKTGFRLHY